MTGMHGAWLESVCDLLYCAFFFAPHGLSFLNYASFRDSCVDINAVQPVL